MNRVDLLGVRIDDVTTECALGRIEDMLCEPCLHLVCTPNADHVVKAWHDADFKTIIEACDLAIPDGMAVIYGSRLLGTPLTGNVAGRLLVPRLCELAAAKGYRIFLFGAAPGVAKEAGFRLEETYPGLDIAGSYSPPFGFDSDLEGNAAAIDAINASDPDILLVGLGAPKQEKWIVANRDRLQVKVAIGVGGTFDILAGRVREAPEWATRIGVEWFFRLLQEPARLGRRYLIEDQEFVRVILLHWLRRRLRLGFGATGVAEE